MNCVNDSVGHFDSKQLQTVIGHLPQTSKFWVGFSGGADSTALLLALHRCRNDLNASIHAMHFHHGLNPGADAWLDHCRDFCAARDIPFSSRILKVQTTDGTSTEENARNARYQAVADFLGQDHIYLTAHHADDQAETLFLNLMRGGGVEGLAGIPKLRTLGAGWVARPLLGFRRPDLEDYLRKHKVKWLEDPSNRDESYDRNYLRNNLFPLIASRWPGLVRNLNRSARHAREASEALAAFINSSSSDLLGSQHRMPLERLLQLELPMQALVLRQWLRLRNIPALTQVRTLEFLSQLADAGPDSQAEVKWDHWQLKLHRQTIWLEDTARAVICSRRDWSKGLKLELNTGLGHLQLHGTPVELPPGWKVGARTEGSKIRLRQNGGRTTLKELYRQSGTPPWLRPAIPVLYWDDEAVAIGDWMIAEKMKNWLNSNSLDYRWHPADPLLIELRSVSSHPTVDP